MTWLLLIGLVFVLVLQFVTICGISVVLEEMEGRWEEDD